MENMQDISNDLAMTLTSLDFSIKRHMSISLSPLVSILISPLEINLLQANHH